MRIISNNTCSKCCYYMDNYDGFGLCCNDTIYKNVLPKQQACKYFCSDDDNDNCNYNNKQSVIDDEEINEYDLY